MEKKMNTQIDPLTGGNYDNEKKVYTHYHKLNDEQATYIMSKLTHKERDAAFNEMANKFK